MLFVKLMAEGLYGVSVMLNRARFHETAAQQIRKQLQLLKAELPLPSQNDSTLAFMAAAGFGSHVLEDDQDDDSDQMSMSLSRTHTDVFRVWVLGFRIMMVTNQVGPPVAY